MPELGRLRNNPQLLSPQRDLFLKMIATGDHRDLSFGEDERAESHLRQMRSGEGGVIPRGSRILQEPESTTRDTCSERQEDLASRFFEDWDCERSNLTRLRSPADSRNSIFERSAFVLKPREVREERTNAGCNLWSGERRRLGRETPPKWHRHQAH